MRGSRSPSSRRRSGRAGRDRAPRARVARAAARRCVASRRARPRPGEAAPSCASSGEEGPGAGRPGSVAVAWWFNGRPGAADARGGRTRRVERLRIAIVGGGSAGLATAALLKESGLDAVVLEAGTEPGSAWRGRYDRLRLHTPRLLSGLPGLRIPRRYGRWVARDDLIEYLRAYVEAHGLDVRTSTRVRRIDPDGDGWRLETDGGPFNADRVVVATGYNGVPFIPDWPGRDSYEGEMIHSSEYRNPAPFAGRDVLVVGAGNSGAEI